MDNNIINDITISDHDIFKVLSGIFGYRSFRPGQKEVIDSILRGKDVLSVMPTGSGKSICYQIPALLLPGITIVISPLISLMNDQVRTLNEAGVAAAFINSTMSVGQVVSCLQDAHDGRIKILYIAPERLSSGRFLNFAESINIPLVVVDEAHCVSQWGHDYRPGYLDIAGFVKTLRTRPVVAAFTATATDTVRKDICDLLALHHPVQQEGGYDRPNLFFSVRPAKDRIDHLLEYVGNHKNESGIIYCATRKNADRLYEKLLKHGIEAARYHAGMSPEERIRTQKLFVRDRARVMVATNAFGMGIDKPDVRYVLHYNMPLSIENYYQEAGRAGRDGLPAECILYFTIQDVIANGKLLRYQRDNNDTVKDDSREVFYRDLKRLREMEEYCRTEGCLRRFLLNYFGEQSECDCGNCSRCTPETDIIPPDSIRVRKKTIAKDLSETEHMLFEQLRLRRKRIAGKRRMPAYMIFNDATLTEMCKARPTNDKEMLAINGVGTYKMEKYGQVFLEEIRSFCNRYASGDGSL